MTVIESWAVILYWVGAAATLVNYPRVTRKGERKLLHFLYAVLLWPVFWCARFVRR